MIDKKFDPISRSKSLLICTNVFQNNLKKKQESNQTEQKDETEPETVDQRIAKLKTKVKGR